MKKRALLGLVSAFTLGLYACGTNDAGSDGAAEKTVEQAEDVELQEEVTLKVAALESGYGADMWQEIKEAYEAANENVTIELELAANLEEIIRPNMQAGDYPDVVLLGTGREDALTETLVREKGLENLTETLGMSVYGEDGKVGEKLMEGFTDTLVTNPYGDGETFLMPMFYTPTGLFYNEGLFEEKGWDLPETWDDMLALGEQAAEEDISLFTYPTTGYFDTIMGSMLYASGGPEFFESAMTYEEGAW